MRVTPRHERFIAAIANSPIHIIATMRGKDQYEVEKDDKGKVAVKKLGVGAKQREGFEYEFTCTFMLDRDSNLAHSQKDNTHIFENDPMVILTEDHGRRVIEWANSGNGYTPKPYNASPPEPVVKTAKVAEKEAAEKEDDMPDETVIPTVALDDKKLEIASLVKSLTESGVTRIDVANAIKSVHIVNGKGSANYNSIQDVSVADAVLEKLNTLVE